MALSIIKTILTLNNSQFSKGLAKSQAQTERFNKGITGLGKNINQVFGVAGAAALAIFARDLAKLNRDVFNAQIAFTRLTTETGLNMEQLRAATGGMIDDLQLMQQTVQALNLGLRASDLPTFFEFAAVRAAETGVAVDYLVNSIVTGVGRQSRLVLDNLGISLIALNAEIANTGDFMTAAVNIINRELEESGRTVEDAASGVQRMGAEWSNLYQAIAAGDVGVQMNDLANRVANALKWIREFGKEQQNILRFWPFGVGQYLYTEYVWEPMKKAAEEAKKVADEWEKANQHVREINRILTTNQALYGYTQGEGTIFAPEPEKIFPREQLRAAIDSLKAQLELIEQTEGTNVWREQQDRILKLISYYQSLLRLTKDIKQEQQVVQRGGGAAPGATGVLGFGFGIDFLRDMGVQFDLTDEALGELIVKMSTMGAKLSMLGGLWQGVGGEIKQVTEEMKRQIDVSALVSQGISSIAMSIGALIGGEESTTVLQNFLRDLGRLMITFGTSLITMGLGVIALESFNPVAMIAGGAAIVAAGAVMAATAGKMRGMASSAGTGYSGAYGGGTYFGGTFDYNREVVMVARGEDLVAVINRQNFRNGINL